MASHALKEQRTRFADLISNNLSYRYWVLAELYEHQTHGERNARKTVLRNGFGFSVTDAPVLTNLAEKVLNGNVLSTEEEFQLSKRLPKYWRQFPTPLEDDGSLNGSSDTPRKPVASERRENTDSLAKEVA